MKCSQCKCDVNKDKLIISGIKYFCSQYCLEEYIKFKREYGENLFKYRTKINPISQKKKERLTNEGSESSLFKKRFKQLKSLGQNYCMITGKLINEDMLSPASFPHILPKGRFPHLRYFTNNIGLVLGIKEHNIFDDWTRKYSKEYGESNLVKDIESGKEVYKDILGYITMNLLFNQ